MTPTLVSALSFLVVSGMVLFFALVLSRRDRLALNTRLALMSSDIKPNDVTVPVEAPAVSQRAAERLRRVVSLGLSRTWGTHASAATVLLLALLGRGGLGRDGLRVESFILDYNCRRGCCVRPVAAYSFRA